MAGASGMAAVVHVQVLVLVARDDIGEAVVHQEEVVEDAGAEASGTVVRRQVAVEVHEGVLPQALLHQPPHVQHAEVHHRLVD